MIILVLNAGSSSLKFSLVGAQDEQIVAEGGIDWSVNPTTLVLRTASKPGWERPLSLSSHRDAVALILEELTKGDHAPINSYVHAVGHRVVHGGDKYTSAVLITQEVKRTIGELSELAPLHNPVSLEVIEAVEQLLPDMTQIAAFDTAFHSSIPSAARTYALPRDWTRRWNLRRYGFHGLSHSYCTSRAAELLKRRDLRLIIAHLGNGASISAVRNGRCIDTSMGFTPLEGLMMGTRSGNVDPGLLLYLLREQHLSADELEHGLNFRSGLLGVSGLSSDMREILAAASHNPDARLALDMYVHRIQQTIGAMAASLDGVDAIVFTAGVGEHSPEVRRRVCENLQHLGVMLDPAANDSAGADSDIALKNSNVRVVIINTREDLAIVREASRLLNQIQAAVTLKEQPCHK